MRIMTNEKIDPNRMEENLSLEVTTDCNSACPHCFARAGISAHASLPFDLAKTISAEGYQTGYRHLHITGGEPLLWDGLFDLLDYAFGLGYETVFLNTNGTLLSGEVNRRLADYKGLTLSVSLQGPAVLHDRVRGSDAYQRTSRGIEKALDAGIGLIIFTATGRSLLAELAGFVDETYKKFPGILSLTVIQLIRVEDDAVDLSEELLTPEDFIRLVRTAALVNLYGHRTDLLYAPLANVAAKMIDMPWIPRSQPLYTEGRLMVRANLDLTLSHAVRDRFFKYEPGMIRQVLTSDAYRKAVEPDRITCPACKFAGLCRANGLLRPAGWFMDMHPQVPYCRRVLDEVALLGS